jgi:hypothetical protein
MGKSVGVKIKIVATPEAHVKVHVEKPEWRKYLYY